jgi:hypothetical protein
MARNPFSVFTRGDSGEKSRKRDEVAIWQQRLRTAMRLREKREKQWREFTRIFNLVKRDVTAREIPTFNTHRGHQIQHKMINLLNKREAKWNVLPMSNNPKAKDNAAIWRGWLSWYMYSHDVRKDVREPFIKDIVVIGTGVNQTGFKVDRKESKPGSQEIAEQMRLAEQASIGALTEEQIQAKIREIQRDMDPIPPEDWKEQNFSDEPYYQNVSTWDFFVAPGFTSIEDAYNGGGWVMKRIVIPLDRAQSDPGYKNRKNITPTRTIKTPEWEFLKTDDPKSTSTGNRNNKAESEFTELFEVWTSPNPFKEGDVGEVKVFQLEGEHFHFEGKNPYPEINGFPFVSENFKDREGEFYGVPYLEHQQEVLDNFDLMRSLQTDIAKVKKPINVGQEGIHEEIDAARIAAAPAGSTILLKNPAGFNQFEWPDASPELINEVNLLSQEILVGSGVGPNQLGAGLSSGASATEASIVQQNIVSDIQTNADKLGREIVKSGRRLVQMLQEKGNPKTILRASNTDGKEITEFALADVIGEFDIRIGAGTALPIDETVRRKQLLDMISSIGSVFPNHLNVERILIDLFELFELPAPQDYVNVDEMRHQHLETAIMFKTKQVVPVLPGDRHMRHIQDLDLVINPMVEAAQQGPASEDDMLDLSNLMKHRQMHVTAVQAQSGNSGVSGTNNQPVLNNTVRGASANAGDQLAATRGAV